MIAPAGILLEPKNQRLELPLPTTWEPPVYPDEPVRFSPDLSVARFGRHILYLDRHERPFQIHKVDDVGTFWATICFFYSVGTIARQADIVESFQVSLASVRRAVKMYLTYDMAGFFAPEQLPTPSSRPPTIASVRRENKAAAKLREQQSSAAPDPRQQKRRAAVLTLPILIQARELLDQGLEPGEVADRLGLQRRSLTSCIRRGLLTSKTEKT